jgi:DNA-binding protein HU-beta
MRAMNRKAGNKGKLINAVAASHPDLSKAEAAAVIDTVFEKIAALTLKSQRFRYPGFGTFEVRYRNPRVVRDPRSGEQVDLPGSKTIGFKPAKAFKGKANTVTADAKGDHVLVCQLDGSHGSLLDTLTKLDATFRLYEFESDLKSPVTVANVTRCPFNQRTFLLDKVNARMIIYLGDNFELVGELVRHGKATLLIPSLMSFADESNYPYLRNLRIDEPTVQSLIARFVERVPGEFSEFNPVESSRNRRLLLELDSAMLKLTTSLHLETHSP